MFKIAWRNVLRNKRRSLLSLAIIIISVIVLFLVQGYIQDTYHGLKMMAISRYGNLQIAKKGFWDQNNTERLLLNKSEVNKIKDILNQKKEITDYTTELKIAGIVGTEKGSHIISGKGIEPSSQQNIMIKSGTKLFPGDKNQVLLGQGVKQKLNLELDENISIMATTLDGAYNANSLQVSGSFSTGNRDADNHYIMLPINLAQNLLNTAGVDKFVIRLSDVELSSQLAQSLSSELKQAGINAEIKTWHDLATMYHQVKGLYDLIFLFISTVIFILVFFSILEIMSMAFFERMTEIGTSRAIGTTRSQIFFQLLQEALILGVLGGLIGVVGGWLISNFINSLHLTYTPPNNSQAVPLTINTSLTNGILPFVLIVLSTSLSALYPAWKAARLNVVEMLRHV